MSANVAHWIEKLNSPDVVIQAEAAESLAHMGTDARTAAVPLVKAAASTDERVREWVVAALESVGVPAAEDLADLRQLVSEEEDDVAYWAITLLGRLKDHAAPAVPLLIEALKHSPYPHNRQRAAWALGKIGPAAKDALPALHEAAHGTDRRLSRIALLSAEQIAEPSR